VTATRSNGSIYVATVFAVLAGYFTYQWWFNPSRAVKQRLGEIAAALSIPAEETDIGRVERVAQLRKFLAADIRVRAGEPAQELRSRDAVIGVVAGFRPASSVDVRFTDTQVFIEADAAAHAYMAIDLVTPDPQSGQPTIDSRDASVDLGKIDGEWLVTIAELKPARPRP